MVQLVARTTGGFKRRQFVRLNFAGERRSRDYFGRRIYAAMVDRYTLVGWFVDRASVRRRSLSDRALRILSRTPPAEPASRFYLPETAAHKRRSRNSSTEVNGGKKVVRGQSQL